MTTQEELQTALERFVAELADGLTQASEVARRLQADGITGQSWNGRKCPVAMWLREKLADLLAPGQEIHAGPVNITIEETSDIMGHAPVAGVSTPGVIGKFLHHFDELGHFKFLSA